MRFRPIGVSSDEVLPEEETYMLLEMSHKSVQCLTYYLLVDGKPMNMEFVMARDDKLPPANIGALLMADGNGKSRTIPQYLN